MATPKKDPKTVTIRGRLSFPNFTMQGALARNATSKFAKDADKVTPDFNLLVEPAHLQKLKDHLVNEFLPYCLEQHNAGEKKDALTDVEVKKLLKVLDAEDWDTQPPYIPIKPVPEKTQALAPEAVANVKVSGNRGSDITLMARVNSEDEILNPDGSQISFPCIMPVGQTVHEMYGGAYVAATLNLYSFVSGKLPGFSASASTCVFLENRDRFGGGVSIDEDEIFLDD